MYELDPYSLEIYRMYENELLKSRLSEVIVLQAYTHTDTHTVCPEKRPKWIL